VVLLVEPFVEDDEFPATEEFDPVVEFDVVFPAVEFPPCTVAVLFN
jgi:hypothetical protein